MLNRIVHQMWQLHDAGGDAPRCFYCGAPVVEKLTPGGDRCYECPVCSWTVAAVYRAAVWPELFSQDAAAIERLMVTTGADYALASRAIADCCGVTR